MIAGVVGFIAGVVVTVVAGVVLVVWLARHEASREDQR